MIKPPQPSPQVSTRQAAQFTKEGSGVGPGVGEGLGEGLGDGSGDGLGEGLGDGEGEGAGSAKTTTSTKVFSPQSQFLLIVTNPYCPQSVPHEFLTIQSPADVYPTSKTAWLMYELEEEGQPLQTPLEYEEKDEDAQMPTGKGP